ncbi:MAG: protein kinase [Woeseiaceae bacterium]|nr:protein kinase [Woeseiaceae bacterium]
MSSDSKRSSEEYSEQLSRFESQLRHTMDDASLQQDVFKAIRELVRDHQESEADIRRVLRARYESGQIREDTLHVVERMLDKVASEYVSTMPEEGEEQDFGATDVIPKSTFGEEDEADQLQPGSILRDRFLLQKRVSGGSMGVVFKALDRRLAEVEGVEPWVAIKVVTPKLSRNALALRAMQQEAAKGRCLSHPNIVRFIDLDRDQDLYFLIMEWIEGRSLAAILDDPGDDSLDTDRTFDIVRQLADALDYAHRCGVVHADVKPGNVMLTPDGQAKLIDFGVARVRQQQDKSRFDPGVLGAATPAYSSMQVLTGEVPVPADDVFSLACLAYRLIAGHRVFGPRNAAQAAESGMSPQRPQGLNEDQWRALRKALSFSRVTRYASTREFAEDFLPKHPNSVPSPAISDDAVSIPARSMPSRRPGAVVAGIAIAIAVAIAAGAAVIFQDDWRSLVARTGVMPAETVAASEAVNHAADSAGPALQPAQAETASDPGAPSEPVATAQAAAPTEDASGADAAPGAGRDATGPAVEARATPASAGDAAADVAATPGTAPTHGLQLGRIDSTGLQMLPVRIREDGSDAIIDLRRPDGGQGELIVVADSSRYGSSRSAWEQGQYRLSGDGIVRFLPGQEVAQLRISMTSDPVREPDRDVLLTLREQDTGAELGLIELTLEDDDQRAFEAGLPPNAVGFAVSQVAAAESDTAVQIDLIRYNADDSPLVAEYRLVDVTATQGDDYFATGSGSVAFVAGQRSARLLIPLVQDADVEADEAFFIELVAPVTNTDADIFRRTAVMIRDDDR